MYLTRVRLVRSFSYSMCSFDWYCPQLDPVAWKQALVLSSTYLFGSGYRRASWQHVSNVSFKLRNSSRSSGVMLILFLAPVDFNKCKNGVGFSTGLSIKFL